MDAPASPRKTKNVKLNLNDILAYRKSLGENQNVFWQRFGVTQSGGSRYESGRNIPRPVRLLITLYAAGKIGDEDLRVAAGAKPKRGKAAA
jgi:DNA-binding transcriptional regulator YiaG